MEELFKELDIIIKTEYFFSNKHGFQYCTLETWSKVENILSKLRRERVLFGDDYHKALGMYKEAYLNGIKHKNYIQTEPRRIAQRYINKREVREFIFNRDKVCLCCGSSENLSIDHIIPVIKNGANDLSNLQTLCKSCNSKKCDKIIDYRKNG